VVQDWTIDPAEKQRGTVQATVTVAPSWRGPRNPSSRGARITGSGGSAILAGFRLRPNRRLIVGTGSPSTPAANPIDPGRKAVPGTR
jgi:hypothetical protein